MCIKYIKKSDKKKLNMTKKYAIKNLTKKKERKKCQKTAANYLSPNNSKTPKIKPLNQKFPQSLKRSLVGASLGSSFLNFLFYSTRERNPNSSSQII